MTKPRPIPCHIRQRSRAIRDRANIDPSVPVWEVCGRTSYGAISAMAVAPIINDDRDMALRDVANAVASMNFVVEPGRPRRYVGAVAHDGSYVIVQIASEAFVPVTAGPVGGR